MGEHGRFAQRTLRDRGGWYAIAPKTPAAIQWVECTCAIHEADRVKRAAALVSAITGRPPCGH